MPSDLPLFTSRPIATNSWVKQDEQYKKDMFLTYVNKAIREKLNGHSQEFDDLVDQFTSQLRIWLLALMHVLSRLERPLVEAIVRLPWSSVNAVFIKSYTEFIGMLISARPEYLLLVLNRIAMEFTYQSGLLAVTSNLDGSTPLTRRVIYDRQYALLEHLLNLVPTLPSSLAPLLIRNFPHQRQPQATHVAYIRNLLRVTEYCGELLERVLCLIVDWALMVDVETQVELEELKDAEPTDGELFEFDLFNTIIGQEDNSSDDEDGDVDDGLNDLSSSASLDSDAEDTPTDTRHIHDMVSKLDAILKLAFDHFNKLHSSIPPVLVPSSPSLHPTTMHNRDPQSHEPHYLLAIQFHGTSSTDLSSAFSSPDIPNSSFSDLFLGLLVDKALFGSKSFGMRSGDVVIQSQHENGLFDSHDEFNEWFSKDIENVAENKGSKLNERQLRRLHMILKPFMLRRTEKVYIQFTRRGAIAHIVPYPDDHYVDLSSRQRTLYCALLANVSVVDLLEKAANIGDADSARSLGNLVGSSISSEAEFAAHASAHPFSISPRLAGSSPVDQLPSLSMQIPEAKRLIYESARLARLDALLQELKAGDHRDRPGKTECDTDRRLLLLLLVVWETPEASTTKKTGEDVHAAEAAKEIGDETDPPGLGDGEADGEGDEKHGEDVPDGGHIVRQRGVAESTSVERRSRAEVRCQTSNVKR
ncbi:RNA polymerase I-specific transcription initiation factor RRN3-domain-containing protein [Suillus occidentalis]|nr:RNA polymerase I-specific transcription initiation factor RRN3-domain-containing protein [Suillus occidentalis]